MRTSADGLVARLRRCWPADVPAGLVADRAFPAKSFFGSLRHGGADFTVRLQARHAVTLATRECRRVGLLLDGPGQPGGPGPAERAAPKAAGEHLPGGTPG